MLREVNLIEYLPSFIQDYREIKHIMNTENPEFQLLSDESERIKNNQFIQTCDLKGIAKFEKLLNIHPSQNDRLESRISRVLVRWNDVVPYTWKIFLRKLDVLCGVGNYDLIPNFNEYELSIKTHLDLYGQIEELNNLVDYMLPANIKVDFKNELEYELKNHMFVNMSNCYCEMYELSDSHKIHFDVNGSVNLGTVVIGTCEVEII